MFSTQMRQDGATKRFPVNGQGTFIYTRKFTGENETGEFAIVVTTENLKAGERPQEYILLHVTPTKVSFNKKEKGQEEGLVVEKAGIGSEPKRLLSYWFSYDRDACTVKYGKGYRMVETTLFAHDFLKKESRKQLEKFFNAAKPIYVMVFFVGGGQFSYMPLIEVESSFQFDENPVVINYPPFVKDSDKISLLDVDQNLFMFSKSLPAACQELYSNIRNMELEYPPDPDYPDMKLSDAIRYSLKTKGMMLSKIIEKKRKSHEFNDPSEVYIRVTLGPDMRTGPGVAYVLELWPSECKSPIHNHGAACAVIKVLFGQIQIKIFNKGSNPPTTTDFIKKFDATKNDVTWMDSNWYQSHQLVNTTNDFCATIQCYKYAAGDKIHWPGFDFIAIGDRKQGPVLDTFMPNSDATYQKMRDTVFKEYQKHLAGKVQPEKV